MSRKPQCLASFALMLGLITVSAAADIGEGLVAYWPLDEGGGTVTSDASGNGSDGTLNGGPSWMAGKFGDALEFDGSDDYVDCGNPPILDFGTSDFTLSAWIKTTSPGGETVVAKGGDDGGGIRWRLYVDGSTIELLLDDDSDKFDPGGSINVTDGQWRHVVGIRRGTTLRAYVDSVEDPDITAHSESTIPAAYDLSGTSQHNAYIGCLTSHGTGEIIKFYAGLIDDVAIWNRALTQEEIDYLWNNGSGNPASVSTPGLASNLLPEDEAIDLLRDDVVLSWSPGEFAVTHDVYLGTSFADVNTANPGTQVSSGQDATRYDPGRLAFDQTYYWRVDEVNGAPDYTVYQGDVLSFTVEPHSTQIPGSTIVATASSISNDFATPETTINGAGLEDNDVHGLTADTMWFSAPVDLDPWIQYELEDVKKLDMMKIWNSNSAAELAIGWGIKDVQIQYSVEGEIWEVLEGVNQLSQAPGSSTYNQYDKIAFDGVAAKYVRLDIESNWGGILMSYGLSEIQFYMISEVARTPEPVSGSVDVLPEGVVTWRAGRAADQHTIYVSTDQNTVADGTAPSVTSSTNSLDLGPLDLELGQTYSWRVDEVNETEAVSVWTGPVWSFTTVDALTVDDFESYNNISPDRPFQAWLDGFGYSEDEFFPAGYGGNGTGAGIGHDIWSLSSPHYDGDIMETANTIAGSNQSMPFYYSNSGGVASETQRTFAVPQDWTSSGTQTLSIAFSGQAGNTGTLYAKINNTKVTYPLDASNIAIGAWQAWNIDLTQVSDNLSSVSKLSIGIEGGTASGMILFDDIKLYAQPGEMMTPEAPDSTGLLAQYTFEGNANDSSGNGLHGTLASSQIVSPGAAGQGSAVGLTPGTYVDLGNPSALDFGTGDWTITAWYKTDITGTDDAGKGTIIGNGGDNTDGHRYALIMNENTGGIVTLVTDDNATKIQANSVTSTNDDQWHFVTGQREGAEIRIYIDGHLEATETVDPAYDLSGTSQHNAYIGAITDNSSGTRYKMLVGSVDEVAIYDRALSAGEILWLAGRTTPFHKPF
ncbi:MAG: discoidin domain-containing protein [Phycisphaeraceae bacterium]|nr:discoidin domain-containing protein [Phycisphaeraceae bacterium]